MFHKRSNFFKVYFKTKHNHKNGNKNHGDNKLKCYMTNNF